MVIASFIFFLLCFVFIGALSYFVNRNNNADYLLASSSVKPWLVALSAVATNNSGYMFIGLIGFTFTAGLQASWLMVGWILGDFIASFFIHKPLREATQRTGSLSFGGVLAQWHGESYRIVRFMAGLATLAFLGTYAAAQLNAGSKALHVLLGWDYNIGAIIGAVIVVIYCFAGGIRASIWTDAAQSFVMFGAMLILLVMGINSLGGWNEMTTQLNNVDPAYMDIFPSDLRYGPLLFVAGWIFAGIGVIGQPHVMVRFMAMDHARNMGRVRLYYYSWYTAFSILAVMTGLVARLIIPFDTGFDTELALPTLAQNILPPVLVGLVLAGLFAATMSTADSQIISCTAAVARDFTADKKPPYWVTKLSTIVITAVALFIALYGSDSVFTLVLIAWSALASIFGPLLIVHVFGGRPGQILSLAMMVAGLVTVLLWRHVGLNNDIYEVMPGILAGLITFAVVKGFSKAIK
jgi:sodium/proline symporter